MNNVVRISGIFEFLEWTSEFDIYHLTPFEYPLNLEEYTDDYEYIFVWPG